MHRKTEETDYYVYADSRDRLLCIRRQQKHMIRYKETKETDFYV